MNIKSNVLTLFTAVMFLAGCSSLNYRIARDKEGRPIPVFGLQSDIVGEASIRINSFGSAIVEVKSAPELLPIPIMTIEEFTRQGRLVRRTQTPLVTGIYNSRVNESMWDGVSKFTRSLSNLAGTILSGIMGIGAAQAVGSTGAQAATAPP